VNQVLSVVPPSSYNEAELDKLVSSETKRAFARSKSPLIENIASKHLVWMPYYRVEFEYRRSEKEVAQQFGETARSETAINAMFCRCAQSHDDSLLLFRPNYLKHSTIAYSPKSGEVTGEPSEIDLDAFLSGFLKRLNEVENELHELKTKSNKRYARIRTYSRILPMIGELKNAEKLSGKTASLVALKNISRLCLNLSEGAGSIRVISSSTFHYPTVAVVLKPREPEAERCLVINLVKSGSVREHLNLDAALTKLCNQNNECRKSLVAQLP
jgi:hypothetical protein